MRKLTYILIAILCTQSLTISSQTTIIKRLGVNYGLSNSDVVSITQDRHGFIWCATEEGLNKFDGSSFISYYKDSTQNISLSGNELNYVYADKHDDIIWIATQRSGLNALYYTQNRLEVFTDSNKKGKSQVTSNEITYISNSRSGNIWIGTYFNGISYYDKSTGLFTHYNQSTIPGLTDNSVATLFEDNNSNLFIGHTTKGLSILSLKTRRVKHFQNIAGDKTSLPSNHITVIKNDSNGNIWIGTNNGLAIFDPINEQFKTITLNKNMPVKIYDIVERKCGEIWIATDLQGVYIIKESSLKNINANRITKHLTEGRYSNNLSALSVRSIFEDSFENMWLGTYGGGVNFICNSTPFFNHIIYDWNRGNTNSLTNKVAWGICFDRKNRLWAGTDGGGVNLFEDNKRVATFNSQNSSLTHDCIISSTCDSDGNIWIGTYSGGLFLYDTSKKNISPLPLHNNKLHDVRAIYEDCNRKLWIGTNYGFTRIDLDNKNNIDHFSRSNCELSDNNVRCIIVDNNNRVWVGTFGQGINIFDSNMKLLKSITVEDGFCSNTINYLYQDKKQNIWAATGDGLVKFPGADYNTHKVYNKNNGLQNSHIRAIAEDTSNNIWVSTNRGISCVIGGGKVNNYNISEEVVVEGFKSYSVAKDRDGFIYFGSLNGICYFNPEIVLSTKYKTCPVITSFEIHSNNLTKNHNINILPKINIKHDENNFTITFNELDYALHNKVEYSYKLSGYSNMWYASNTKNTATFFNVKPGVYEFELKARIKNEAWSSLNDTLVIEVEPSFWNSKFAYIFYIVSFTALVFFILNTYRKRLYWKSVYMLQKKQHEYECELNDERLRFYTNITHELRTPLTMIVGPLDDLQKDISLLPQHIKKIDYIHKSAYRLLKLVNQILKFRTIETQNHKLSVSRDNLAVIIEDIWSKYKELKVKDDIDFNLKIEDIDFNFIFDKEVITIIVDNLISNAIKYTENGSIYISVNKKTKAGTEYVTVSVEDTGYGIPKESMNKIFDRFYQVRGKHQASGTGIGLALVKSMAELHEGEISVTSTLGKGSCFTFSLLANNTYPNALHDNREIDISVERHSDGFLANNNSLGKPMLLLIEDDVYIRQYIAETLSESFEIITAENGDSGLNIALERIPDIIVSDIMMPIMNGIELCKKLKEDIKTSHIPIILLTAKDSLTDKEEGYLIGADSYMTKPFNSTLLHSRINNLLESRRQLAKLLISTDSLTSLKTNITDDNVINKIDNDFINRLITHIEANIQSERVDVSYLAKKVHMSNSTLYRKVKALTGLSPIEYIKKIKMRKAKVLLLEKSHTVSEVAYMIGFSNVVYFRQCFKDEFGIVPSEVSRK